MVTKSRGSIVTDLRALQAGIQKHLQRRTILIAEKSYSRSALVARIQRALDAQRDVERAKAQLINALRADRALRAADRPFFASLKTILLWGEDPATLGDYGLTRRKKARRLTAEELLLAREKNRATRVVRKTMGSKQKKKLKGSVVGVVVTPVTTDVKKDEG